MKKLILLTTIVISALIFFGCNEEFAPAGETRGIIVPVVSDINPAFFDLSDLENAYVQFTVNVEDASKVDGVAIQASYKGQQQRIEIAKVSSFPASFTITAAAAAQALGVKTSDIALGDIFNFEIIVIEKGEEYRSNAAVNANVACATDLAGTYSLSATGTGGGGLGEANPWTSSIETAVIESKGGVTYSITPALGGIMVDFYSAYGATLVTGEFQDVCGIITNSVVNDGWSAAVLYEGSVDEVTGVITINWENPWGDSFTMILTPQ